MKIYSTTEWTLMHLASLHDAPLFHDSPCYLTWCTSLSWFTLLPYMMLFASLSLVHTMLVIMLVLLPMVTQEQLATFVHASKNYVVNQHGACECASVCNKAHPRCKLHGQIVGGTWPSSLVVQLKSPGVADKPSGFIASNDADRFRHPGRLNVGKCQRKADRLLGLRFFLAAIFVIHSPHPTPITIAGHSNSRYCVFIQHVKKI